MARFHLRLSDGEFFALTPRQLQLLLERHRDGTRHQELLAGIVAATVANHSFAPPKQAAAPGDFMPSEWQRRHERPARLNRRAVADQVRCFLKARVGLEH